MQLLCCDAARRTLCITPEQFRFLKGWLQAGWGRGTNKREEAGRIFCILQKIDLLKYFTLKFFVRFLHGLNCPRPPPPPYNVAIIIHDLCVLSHVTERIGGRGWAKKHISHKKKMHCEEFHTALKFDFHSK